MSKMPAFGSPLSLFLIMLVGWVLSYVFGYLYQRLLQVLGIEDELQSSIRRSQINFKRRERDFNRCWNN